MPLLETRKEISGGKRWRQGWAVVAAVKDSLENLAGPGATHKGGWGSGWREDVGLGYRVRCWVHIVDVGNGKDGWI